MIEAGKKYRHVAWDSSRSYVLIISVNRGWVEAVYSDSIKNGTVEKYELQAFAYGWVRYIDFQEELEWL